MRKLLIRSVIVCIALFVVGACSVGIALVLACSKPGFYTQLQGQTLTAEEEQQLQAEMQTRLQSLEIWAAMSAAKADAAEQGQPFPFRPQAVAHIGGDPDLDYAAPRQTLTITEAELNGILQSQRAGDVRAPRVQILEDRVRVGCEIDTGSLSCVATIDLNVVHTEENELRFDILGGQIGRLPIPLKTLLKSLPAKMVKGSKDVEFNLSADTPHLLLKLDRPNRPLPRLQSVQATDGQILIDFSAPVPAAA